MLSAPLILPRVRPVTRRRLPERKPPVTIAAGLVCSDGVVLCADTQLTSNYKQPGQKLWLHEAAHLSVAMTGAGDYVLLKLVNGTIRHRIKGRMSLDRVLHGIVEPVLASVHADHIDKAPDWRVQNGYDVNVIVAIKTRTGVRLYESSRTGVSEITDYRCVGAGSPVGNYIAGNLFSPSLSVLWGQVCAAYLIQQTKAYGMDCGGETSIVVMPKDGPAVLLPPAEVRQIELVANRIHEAFSPVMTACAEPQLDGDGQDLEEAITIFKNAVTLARNHTIFQTFTQYAQQTLTQVGQPTRKTPKHDRKARKPSRA